MTELLEHLTATVVASHRARHERNANVTIVERGELANRFLNGFDGPTITDALVAARNGVPMSSVTRLIAVAELASPNLTRRRLAAHVAARR